MSYRSSRSQPTKAQRRRVLTRDDWTCQACGAHGTEVDHIRAGITGPVPDEALQALCSRCHWAKTRGEISAAVTAANRRRARKPRPPVRKPHPGRRVAVR